MYKVSISRRDSGSESHTLGEAYKNIEWDLAKFKQVTVWSSQLSSLTRVVTHCIVPKQSECWLNFSNM